MSEAASGRDAAIGFVELDSVARGVLVADAMVKASPIGSIYSGTVQPGKYLVLVSGDTASVVAAMDVGREIAGRRAIDEIVLPDIHVAVVDAIVEPGAGADLGDEAVADRRTTTPGLCFHADHGSVGGRGDGHLYPVLAGDG